MAREWSWRRLGQLVGVDKLLHALGRVFLLYLLYHLVKGGAAGVLVDNAEWNTRGFNQVVGRSPVRRVMVPPARCRSWDRCPS